MTKVLPMMLDPVLALLISLGGALLFAVASIHKLRSMRHFVATLGEYGLLQHRLIAPVAWLLALLELITAALLVLPPTHSVGGIAAAALLTTYAAAMGFNLARGRTHLDCGCSTRSQPIGGWMVIRNLLLAAALGSLMLPVAGRAIGWGDAVTLGGGLLVAALLYGSMDLLFGRSLTSGGYPVERT